MSSIGNNNDRPNKNTFSLLKPSENVFSSSYTFFGKNNSSLVALNFFIIFNSSDTNFFDRNNPNLISLDFFFIFNSCHANKNSS